ncbi:MAG TPA: LysR family transcriptional regulator, partial [Aestuariivirga sp.]|nr:LysR family transcriptional regulator [Aestuariivirga sp.]
MRNIPTDLLRAFVTIIDLRGYTRAGEQLGRTQPAISLQMRRLQELLGVQLFAKDGNSTQVTEAGEIVAGYARQILMLNDEMMLPLTNRAAAGKLRLGIPNDYADHFLP